MTTFEKIDAALVARGWRYDRNEQQFVDGVRVLNWEEVIGLVPGMTPDELASYEDDKWDKSPAAREFA
jgi:hypothetical protein